MTIYNDSFSCRRIRSTVTPLGFALDLTRAGSHVTPWKEKWAKDVFFGMNVLHESNGVLRVGDQVDVLRVASDTSEKKTQ